MAVLAAAPRECSANELMHRPSTFSSDSRDVAPFHLIDQQKVSTIYTTVMCAIRMEFPRSSAPSRAMTANRCGDQVDVAELPRRRRRLEYAMNAGGGTGVPRSSRRITERRGHAPWTVSFLSAIGR